MKQNIKLLAIVFLMGFIAACSSDNDDNGTEGPGEKPGPPAQQDIILPKDLRAVWFTTVWELDWPTKQYNKEAQQQLYIDYLDEFKKYNINAVFVQVKSKGDAFYKSKFEPWSKHITGQRGQDPGYDVMQFMIDEAHKRDLEFHAWINPYRIDTRGSVNEEFDPLLMDLDDNMYIDLPTLRIYNPARPEVRERLRDIVDEIISNYDVDGIVMDDYFYPAENQGGGDGFPDDKDFKELAEADQSKKEFRTDNVNKMVKMIHELIITKKPQITFTMSPQGNDDNNKKLYADPVEWCKKGWVDFIMPQLYYTKETDFQKWANYWSRYSYYKTPMVAYGLYKVDNPKESPGFTAQTFQNQFNYISRDPRYQGSSFYSAKYFLSEKVSSAMDVVKKHFAKPALIPFSGRKGLTAPKAPTNLELINNTLKWSSDEKDVKYAVYRIQPNDYEKKKVIAELVTITDKTESSISQKGKYYVTAINKINHESKLSSAVHK